MLTEEEKADIVQMWRTVRKLCKPSLGGVFLADGSLFCQTRPEDSYDLPFVLAYAVLDQVLQAYETAGLFTCRKYPTLGSRMEASRSCLSWIAYDVIWHGKEARDELAHEAKLLGRPDCMTYIDAIEVEMKEFGIL